MPHLFSGPSSIPLVGSRRSVFRHSMTGRSVVGLLVGRNLGRSVGLSGIGLVWYGSGLVAVGSGSVCFSSLLLGSSVVTVERL